MPGSVSLRPHSQLLSGPPPVLPCLREWAGRGRRQHVPLCLLKGVSALGTAGGFSLLLLCNAAGLAGAGCSTAAAGVQRRSGEASRDSHPEGAAPAAPLSPAVRQRRWGSEHHSAPPDLPVLPPSHPASLTSPLPLLLCRTVAPPPAAPRLQGGVALWRARVLHRPPRGVHQRHPCHHPCERQHAEHG